MKEATACPTADSTCQAHLRILMLTSHPHVQGPISKHSPLLVHSLQAEGCEVLTRTWGRHNDHETIFEKSVGRLRAIFQIRQILKRRRFDVLFLRTAHDWRTLSRDIPLLFFTRHLCPRTVLMFHGSSPNLLVQPRQFVFKQTTSWLLHLADAFLVLSSEEQMQWKASYPNHKFFTVSNPFDANGSARRTVAASPRLIPQDRTVLLFVGRLVQAKGILDLLDAMGNVVKQDRYHLLIAGNGSDAELVRTRIKQLHLSEHVTMLGWAEGDLLAAAYESADVFVLPTYWAEGFPTVIAEAMAAGLPIITTRIRGAADHLLPRVHALFVPPQAPAALADAIVTLSQDTDLRSRMAQANREKVKDFAPDVVAKKYLKILRDVVTQT